MPVRHGIITFASVGVSPPNLFLSWPALSLTIPHLRGRERVGEFAKRLKRRTKAGTTPAFFFAPHFALHVTVLAIARALSRAARTMRLIRPHYRGREEHVTQIRFNLTYSY